MNPFSTSHNQLDYLDKELTTSLGRWLEMLNLLRSTRFGLSAAITPYGEMVSQMSSFDDHNKIMYA